MDFKEKLIHTMSITKAAVGLIYHKYDEEYRRYYGIENNEGKNICNIGQALNMLSGYSDSEWDYEDFRSQVENNRNLLFYSHGQLNGAKKTRSMEYNNLMYQVLASMMKDLIDKFGDLMGDKAGELVEEKDYKNTFVYFKYGKEWKWEHTKDGEPLGPHGLWMTDSFAKRFGEKARDYIIKMSPSEKNQIPSEVWKDYLNNTGHLKKYWNGWWFSDKCAYAIGHVVQVIAITPKDVRIQIYEENWESPLDKEENWNDYRWKFIDNIEAKW